MNFQKSRNLMVENQLRPNKITNPRIINIFNDVEKEHFLINDLKSIAYSDIDINLIGNNRGYLKNLHIAQLIQYSNITKNDKVLHIGGLTGYVSLILSKLSDYVVVIENNEVLLKQLEENLSKFQLTNVEIINTDLRFGYNEKSPYDLIFIDCPLNKVPNVIIDQLSFDHGRVIAIEKQNFILGNGVRITKSKKNYNKEILFDSFSTFMLYEDKEEFIF